MNKCKILIVEDNASFALELEMMVIDAGYHLIGTTPNSEDALGIIKKEKPDLVIMDIDIDGKMNGVEVAKIIKADNVPVIYSTSNKDKETYEEAKLALTQAYLVKPFDMLTLQSVIEFAVKSITSSKRDNLPSEGEEWDKNLIVQGSFLIKNKGVLFKLKCTDIEYVQSDWNYCMLYSKNKKYAVKMSLKKIKEKLGNLFIPIHKSYLVQLKLIEKIDTSANKVLLSNAVLPIGRTFKQDLLSRFETLK